jgi:CheY-like chemotaxis protein
MGGEFRVDSEVGRGTTFTFDIVCRSAQAVEPASMLFNKQVIDLAPGQPKFRIMVVDDKEINRQFIVRLLEPLGFELLEAEDGAEAVRFATSFEPHLIWMDIRMPVLDGIEATRQLKSGAGGESVKIIALTASIYDEDRDTESLLDFDEFVRKPIHAEVIFEIMHRHLGVEYVYAPIDSLKIPDGPTQLSADEARDALASVPTDLIMRLNTGTGLGDMNVINEAISEISRYHVALAANLARLAEGFHFDDLLALLQEIEKS